MTEQELIQLLQEKPASDFTPEEMASLRAQWVQSPELRQALVEHLHLESQLAGALGHVELDIDCILQRAAEQKPSSSGGSFTGWRWAIGLCLLIAVVIGFGLRFGNDKQKQVVALNPNREKPTQSESVADSVADALIPENGVVSDGAADQAVAAASANNGKTASADNQGATSKGAVAAPPVVEPWSAAMARDVAPWPAGSPKLTRDFKSAGHDDLSDAEAKRWFSQVEGHAYQWAQDVFGAQHKRAARFHGLARLRAPWSDEAILRLTPFDVTDLTLYFWRGPEGLALRFYTRREPHLWAAFAITRENSSPKPLRFGLLTTDNGSYSRAGSGTLDLRYQNGGITLARGGVTLLTAPMASLPDEVFIEGQFRLRGVSMHKSAPFPSVPENPHPIVAGGGPADELPWAASAESPASLITNGDGSVTLTTNSATQPGLVVLPFGQRGLYEVIARVESADPGTGLYLGDVDGRPVHRIGYFNDTATKQITCGVLKPSEVRDSSTFDPNAFPPPYHSPKQWIKIVAGLSTVQVLVSGDGRHWGHLVENPTRDLLGAVASVGLFGLPGPTPRTLKLSQLEIRELTGVTSLAESNLVALSPRFSDEELKSSTKWTHRVLETHPTEVELPRWFNACAVAALSQGPPREFAIPMLRRLVAIGIRSTATVPQKLQLLNDAALLADWFDESQAKIIALHFDELAQQMSETGEQAPLTTIRPALLRTPVWTASRMKWAWERQNSREVLLSAYRGSWSEAWQTSQTALFWNTGAHPDFKPAERSEELDRHARWAKAVATETMPQLDDGSVGAFPGAWRHPLALQWNKEAYNVRSELQSALVGQTYEDACKIVMSIGEQDGPGLLPDMDDTQLFVSLPTAVAGAMLTYPDFGKLMVEKFGPLGMIRVRNAINSGNVRGVQAATLQFYGTEAAAEAHGWLGDRDLSAGRFAAAEEHFLLALDHASARQREGLESRLQLATTLNGQTLATPIVAPKRPIDFNGTTLEPAAFESLVRDLQARASIANRLVAAVASAPQSPLAPSAYKLEPKSVFDGQPGNNPGRYEYRFGDPFARQLGVAADGQRLYVSNRFQVNAFSVADGKSIWAQGLGAEQGDAYGLPFTPMLPLVAGDRLFVRRLTKGGAELAALRCNDGSVIWKQRPGLQVLTDPIVWNGNLFALTLGRSDDDLVQVEATRFDTETGAATSSQPLFRMKDQGDRSLIAQLTLAGRLAVCTIGGTTACFDSAGDVHWIRRHTWLPKSIDEMSEDYRVFTPVVRGDRVIVSLQGVRTVCCLHLTTGRRMWERPLADLRGVMTVSGSRVLVDTASGVAAFSLDDGSSVWTRPLDFPLEAFHAAADSVVLSYREKGSPAKTKPILMWLDLNTGRELAQSRVEGAEKDESQLGPLLFASGRWWTFSGQGWKDPKRELNELVKVPPLVPGPFENRALGMWQPDVSESQQSDIALILPGWFPAASYGSLNKLAIVEALNESRVLSANLLPAQDLTLIGQVEIPESKKTTLRMRVGSQPDKNWKLAVRVGDRVLLEKVIGESQPMGGWQDVSVDLSSFAGRSIPIQLQHSSTKALPTDVLWKQVQMFVE